MRTLFPVLSAGSLAMLATAAIADVKTGVEAWGRGDFDAAVREWVDPAAKGDPDARFNLGQAYRLGRGVLVDLARAETLYAQAAAAGHAQAADQYGLLLYQRGEREKAMSYVKTAAERGNPRAQFLLGLAHFNGDLAAMDWPRAYALLLLANDAGLAQAQAVLATMDEHIPPAQREQAKAIARQMRDRVEALDDGEQPAADLALAHESLVPPASPSLPAAPVPPLAMASQAAPAPAVALGEWKVQLGAFTISANADLMWSQMSERPEIAGREKLIRRTGKFTLLLAGGYSNRSEASAACISMRRKGYDCLVTR